MTKVVPCFTIEWTYRFAEGLPLFVAISGGGARIFLPAEYGMREVALTDPDGNRLRIGSR